MALVLANRVQETGTANTTVSFTLAGAVLGFQTFAVIGNTNTTYYSATDASGNWEVGLGTYSTTGPTLTRTTVYASSNSGSAVTFSGTVTVFVTYPSGRSVNLDASGNVSPLGTVASGTWQGSTVDVAYGGTGVTTSSGANSVMLRDANQNVAVNRLNQTDTATTAAGGTTALTAASSYSQTLNGTGGQTYTMPDATTLTTAVAFIFNNNATGTLTLKDYAGATIGTITSGGAAELVLLANGTVAGTWDVHGFLPESVTWGTNALALGSTVITGGTWNGGTITSGYGGTGLTTFAAANNALYSTSASALAAGTLPVAAGGTGATTLTGYVYGNGTGAFTASASIPNSATTATSANTASTIVARDASGNFSAGTITAALNGNASTATTAANVNNGTLTMAVSGTGLSGSATFTANQSGNSTFTVASNATNANTASTIVARDASGNFSAGTITATLSGNASTATSASTSTTQAKSDASTNIATTAFAKQLFYSPSTAGTLDWNDVSNTRPGAGTTLLLGSATNGPGGGNYYIPFNYEYSSFDGTGNVTQTAIAYGTPGNELWMRGRYTGTWSSWVRYLNSSNYNSYAPTLTGTGASGTWGINVTGSAGSASTSSDSSLLNGISAVNLYNNMGQAHSTRTSFDASTPSYNFGYRYVQGSTNGPGTSGSQYYSWYIGLGSDYPATGANSYGAMFAVDRNVATPYLSVRYNESNSFSSWRKVAAGYADSAGSATTATTATTANALNTGNNYQVNSLGVGTAASGTAGEIRATNNVTAYYSDERLKTKISGIDNALAKVRSLEGFLYHANDVAASMGYDPSVIDVGLSAQKVQQVQPEVVAPAPIDENYLTVRYERLVPLLVEAIKELADMVEELKQGR